MSQGPTKARMGRPPKPVEKDAPVRTTYSVRLRSAARAELLATSEANGRSVSEEIERRIEQSLFYERFLGTLAGNGPSASLFRVIQKVVDQVLRLSEGHIDDGDDSPEENERNVRRELHSAIDFVSRVYFGTGEPLPEEFDIDGARPGNWGSGDIGRLHAQVFLNNWADDLGRLARARSREVDFYWTPGPPPRGLAEIMNENTDRKRDRAVPLHMPRDDIKPKKGRA